MLANRKQTERLGFETLLLSIHKLDSIEQKKLRKVKKWSIIGFQLFPFHSFFQPAKHNLRGSVLYTIVFLSYSFLNIRPYNLLLFPKSRWAITHIAI